LPERTIAITGATGLIGTALAQSLRAAGNAVRPVVRRPSDDPGAVRWDPAEGTIDAAGLAGVDAVVHLAGAGIGDKRWSAERKREILESRTQGTALIARTLAEMPTPPATFVSGSAIGFYGSPGDEVVTEQSRPGNDFVAEVVQAWEAAAQPAPDAGIRTVFLRSGIVLSGSGGILPRMALPFRFFVGGRLGSGRQWMSWISIDDAIGAMHHALLTPDLSGAVNAAAPEPVTSRVFAATLGRVLGRPALLPAPAPALRLLFGEMADTALLGSQRLAAPRLLASGYSFRHPRLETALRHVLGRPL
jgi:uncharacterized protein (TIGR01777 family)